MLSLFNNIFWVKCIRSLCFTCSRPTRICVFLLVLSDQIKFNLSYLCNLHHVIILLTSYLRNAKYQIKEWVLPSNYKFTLNSKPSYQTHLTLAQCWCDNNTVYMYNTAFISLRLLTNFHYNITSNCKHCYVHYNTD